MPTGIGPQLLPRSQSLRADSLNESLTRLTYRITVDLFPATVAQRHITYKRYAQCDPIRPSEAPPGKYRVRLGYDALRTSEVRLTHANDKDLLDDPSDRSLDNVVS